MIPNREVANWERPFLAVQGGIDRLVNQSGRLPGLVHLALYPLAIVVACVNIPVVLTHFCLSAILKRPTAQLPANLDRHELVAWSHELHAKWIARHESLRQCNPHEIADDLALPVINALQDAVAELQHEQIDDIRLEQIATRLILLPITRAPDAHSLGLCIRDYLRSGEVPSPTNS